VIDGIVLPVIKNYPRAAAGDGRRGDVGIHT
jgi:hypothetical protein